MKIVLVRANPYDVNPAVPRTIEACRDVFSSVHVLCWNHKGLPLSRHNKLKPAKISIFGFVLTSNLLRTAMGVLLYQFWVFKSLLALRPNVVQAFDVYSLVPALIARVFIGCRVIYDIRDPFALSFGFSTPVRKVVYCADWLMMGLSSAFVVPDDSRIPYLGKWSKSTRPVVVIKNTCHDEFERIMSLEFKDIPPRGSGVRIAFVGYLAFSRGARSLIQLCGDDQSGALLWAAGACSPKSMEDEIKALPNAVWWGKCSREKSLALMAAADITAILYDPAVPVNRMAAPNKLYESLMMGTPLLISRGMRQAEWVSRNELGYVVEYGDMRELKNVIKCLQNKQTLTGLRKKCREYFMEYPTLRQELIKYRRFYHNLIRNR